MKRKDANHARNLYRRVVAYRPGLFKTHSYSSYRLAPSTDNNNSHLDSLIKAFHSIQNNQIFKAFRDGQPVIALELYADHEKSFYMYTVPSSHQTLFKERIESAFKGGGVKLYEHNDFPFVENAYDNVLIARLNLTKNSFFPISMKEDLLICQDIHHVLDDLKTGEKCFIQILLEPADNGWQEELEQQYEAYLEGKVKSASGGFLKASGRQLDEKITKMAQSMVQTDEYPMRGRKHREIKEFQSKVRQHGFEVAIRILTQAASYERRNDITEGVAGAFKTSNFHNGWQLSPTIRKRKAFDDTRNRKMPLLSSINLLCDDEVKTLLRLPTKEIQTLKLERMKPDEERIDERLTTHIIPIGRSIKYDSEGKEIGFSIANADTASKARLWIAPPGSGKSTAVKRFKNGAMLAGHGGSIFDVADGRLYYEAIETTPEKDRDRLVLVNFANEHYPHIFNFNSLGSDAEEVGAMFAEFFEVYFHTQANYRMNSFLRKASMTVFINPDATFLELIQLMRDEDYRRRFLPKIRKSHPDLFLWWKTEFPKIIKSDQMANEILQPILYRLDNLQYNKRLGPIFCGKGGKLEIAKWMNEGRWVLYNLSGGVFLENEQRMMMSFLNYAYWTATLMREKMLQNGVEPIIHHKIYDEPQTYMTATPIFKLSISKSRKYRVSDNFLIQNPSQVIEKDKELWKQIIGMNPHIVVGGGLDVDSLKEVSKIMNITQDELRQIEHLEYHWYLKTYVGKEAIKPFIFNAEGMPKEYGKDPALLLKWRQHFAPHTYENVRKELSARNLQLTVDEYEKLLESYDDSEEEGVPIG